MSNIIIKSESEKNTGYLLNLCGIYECNKGHEDGTPLKLIFSTITKEIQPNGDVVFTIKKN